MGQTLVRRVLVDDDDAIRRLRHDIGLVHLRARDAQRKGRGVNLLRLDHANGSLGHARQRARRLEFRRRLGQATRRRAVTARQPIPAAMRSHRHRAARADRIERGRADRGGGAVAGACQRVLQRADDEAARARGVAEAYLGLRRMDVHVHLVRRHIEEQRHHGMPVARQHILVSRAHGAGQQPVAHRTAVDEQELHPRGRAVEGGQAGMSGQAQPLALGVNGQGIVGEVAPHHSGQAAAPRREQIAERGRQHQGLSPVVRQGKGDARMGHGQPLDRVERMHRFGPLGLEELEAGGRGIEQVAHLDTRALRVGGRRGRRLVAALDQNLPCGARPTRAAGDAQTADRADGGQRLATEAQAADMHQIVVGQL